MVFDYGMAIVNRQGRLLLANHCARQMFGRVQKPAKSVHVAGHVHRDDATPDLFSGPTNDERFALMDV